MDPNAQNGLWALQGLAPKRSPGLTDMWRLRRTLQPGTEYGHFHEGSFPKIGKLQKPVISYREMVKRRYAKSEVGMWRLESTLVVHLGCAGYLRKQVEEEMQRHPQPFQPDILASKLGFLQRILTYPFGAQGDKVHRDDHTGKPGVEKFNKEAELLEEYTKHNEQSQIRELAADKLGE